MLVFGLRLIRYSLLSETLSESKIHQNAFAAVASLQTPLWELTKLPTLSSRLGRMWGFPSPHSLVDWGGETPHSPQYSPLYRGKVYFCTSIFLASVFIVFINNYLDSFLLELCYYRIYLPSYTSSCTVMQITDVKIQLQKSKGLNFGQSSAKHARRNAQNDCHHLSDSSKVHQIRFRPGFRPDPAGGAYDAPPDPLVGCGGGNPLPIPHPLDALASRHSTLSASCPPTFKSLATPLLWDTLAGGNK